MYLVNIDNFKILSSYIKDHLIWLKTWLSVLSVLKIFLGVFKMKSAITLRISIFLFLRSQKQLERSSEMLSYDLLIVWILLWAVEMKTKCLMVAATRAREDESCCVAVDNSSSTNKLHYLFSEKKNLLPINYFYRVAEMSQNKNIGQSNPSI